MSPKTKLLVYYIKSDLETVADSIPLFVENRLENKISVRFNKNVTMPGEMARLQVVLFVNIFVFFDIFSNIFPLVLVF